jgi:hypothetical protein
MLGTDEDDAAPSPAPEGDPGREVFRSSEDAIAWARLVVVASLVPTSSSCRGPGGERAVPVAVFGVTLAYSVWVVARRPHRRPSVLSSAAFVSAADATLITAFLATTGGIGSPYYPLWYVSIVAFSFRYGPWTTALGASLYAGGVRGPGRRPAAGAAGGGGAGRADRVRVPGRALGRAARARGADPDGGQARVPARRSCARRTRTSSR